MFDRPRINPQPTNSEEVINFAELLRKTLMGTVKRWRNVTTPISICYEINSIID